VSAEVKRGEFVAVLGANGCGKSTLAKHFNAILLPESGTVLVEGMDTKDEDKIYDIRQTVGMVFQSPDNQIVATVVEEDVAFALENLGVPPEEMRRRVDEAMKMAGIYEYRGACAPLPVRRSEAACCLCGRGCHAARLPDPGRCHRHA
jgi:ABC-type cobalt transport system, ATPase component